MKQENLVRNEKGRFEPVYKTWSLNNFNEGYIPKHERRFMVRLPKHHRANANGWVLRSIAAYEAYHPGEKITKEFVAHHKDEDKLNDSKENLKKIEFGAHTRLHWLGKSRIKQNKHLKNGKIVNCDYCKKEFYRAPWETHKNNYCNRDCKHNVGKEIRECPICKNKFEIIKSSLKICCSRHCGFTLRYGEKYNGK